MTSVPCVRGVSKSDVRESIESEPAPLAAGSHARRPRCPLVTLARLRVAVRVSVCPTLAPSHCPLVTLVLPHLQVAVHVPASVHVRDAIDDARSIELDRGAVEPAVRQRIPEVAAGSEAGEHVED